MIEILKQKIFKLETCLNLNTHKTKTFSKIMS